MKFEKYQGLGNDYLVYDVNKNKHELSTEEVKLLCDRNFGLGSDGILSGPYFYGDKMTVRILNPDGSEAEKSGNGIRIFSKYLWDAGYVKTKKFDLYTITDKVKVEFLNDAATLMTVSMGRLDFSREAVGALGVPEQMINIPMMFGATEYMATCVSIGNPHCVIPVEEVSPELVKKIGKYSETAGYFPNRINTQIVQVLDRHNIRIEIFERGAGYTLASGSSSCAAAGAVHKLGMVDDDVKVHMPGGELTIHFDGDDVTMTGPVGYIGTMIPSSELISEV